ncbi:MAG: histidine phosphatase family protein [Bacteroidetes bacterium]|nr:histidine phosphatase family protein [Bacteroidota bacterium]MBU2508460.1 histidine phosphatase family protein [Bacteroidota bacterium]
MKTLYLLRHAKSSWKYIDLPDEERPLSIRGKSDAPLMGKVLANMNVQVDIIIASPAQRAKQTALEISKKLGFNKSKIVIEDLIYESGTADLLTVLKSISDKNDFALMVGHNPGFTLLHNYLCNFHIDNIPTCGITAIKLKISKWAELKAKCGKLLFYDYPKNHY